MIDPIIGLVALSVCGLIVNREAVVSSMIEHIYTAISDDEVIQHRRLNFKIFIFRLKDKVYEREHMEEIAVFGVIVPNSRFSLWDRWFDEKGESTRQICNQINEMISSIKGE